MPDFTDAKEFIARADRNLKRYRTRLREDITINAIGGMAIEAV